MAPLPIQQGHDEQNPLWIAREEHGNTEHKDQAMGRKKPQAEGLTRARAWLHAVAELEVEAQRLRPASTSAARPGTSVGDGEKFRWAGDTLKVS